MSGYTDVLAELETELQNPEGEETLLWVAPPTPTPKALRSRPRAPPGTLSMSPSSMRCTSPAVQDGDEVEHEQQPVSPVLRLSAPATVPPPAATNEVQNPRLSAPAATSASFLSAPRVLARGSASNTPESATRTLGFTPSPSPRSHARSILATPSPRSSARSIGGTPSPTPTSNFDVTSNHQGTPTSQTYSRSPINGDGGDGASGDGGVGTASPVLDSNSPASSFAPSPQVSGASSGLAVVSPTGSHSEVGQSSPAEIKSPADTAVPQSTFDPASKPPTPLRRTPRSRSSRSIGRFSDATPGATPGAGDGGYRFGTPPTTTSGRPSLGASFRLTTPRRPPPMPSPKIRSPTSARTLHRTNSLPRSTQYSPTSRGPPSSPTYTDGPDAGPMHQNSSRRTDSLPRGATPPKASEPEDDAAHATARRALSMRSPRRSFMNASGGAGGSARSGGQVMESPRRHSFNWGSRSSAGGSASSSRVGSPFARITVPQPFALASEKRSEEARRRKEERRKEEENQGEKVRKFKALPMPAFYNERK